MIKTPNLEELNKFYQKAEEADKEIFSEQRSNVLLVSGDHYSKRSGRMLDRIRHTRATEDTKLRLTKNHIQKITKIYVNNLVASNPSVKILPRNEKELQDQKAAELTDSVWQYYRSKHKLSLKTLDFAKDFIEIGEVAALLRWNPDKGEFLGYEVMMDEETGEEMIDEESMEPRPDKSKPVFTGDFELEKIHPFNLLRDPDSECMDESEYLIVRRMMDVETLKKRYMSDPDKAEAIEKSSEDTFRIFDGSSGKYEERKNQVMVREYYFRPSIKYPEGYFAITTKEVLLEEGELPFAIFPIITTGFDSIQTSARHRSIIKQLRPFQVEINRSASKIAETQIASDDKLLVQQGTKLTAGGGIPGVRVLQYSGLKPEFMSGRTGEQYLPYMESQIAEMYDVANVVEDMKEKEQGQADPYSLLFKSFKNKKKFVIYAERFNNFLQELAMLYIKMSKVYLPDDMAIPMLGRHEAVNIEEFRNTSEMFYQVKVEPLSDDIETMMGKQLVINHALQYIGGQLERDDVGKLMRAMPFGNFEEAFSDLTIDYDSANNLVLALDRGEPVEPSRYDNHQYMIKRLTHRMRQSDFKMLTPEVQQNYQQTLQMFQQIEMQIQQELLRAQSGYIPADGASVRCDLYVQNEEGKTKRAEVPSTALKWLLDKLEEQGSTLGPIEEMNQGVAAEIAQMLAMQGVGADSGAGEMGQGGPMPPEMLPQQPM